MISTKLRIRSETIASQEAVAEINKKIIIAHDNVALTEEWVRQVLSGNDISVVLVPVSLDDTHPQARQSSMLAALSNAMPDDVDWVWTLTDDASLYSKFSLEQVWTHLQAPSHQDVRFVHTCLAPKSYDTGYAQKASVRSLCESHGYFEILGSTSSLVLAKDVFCLAFGEHLGAIAEQARNADIRITRFTQCQLLYVTLAEMNGLLIDSKLVAQDSVKTFDIHSDISESKQMFLIAGELVAAHILESENSWGIHSFVSDKKHLDRVVGLSGSLRASFDNEIAQDNADMVFIDNSGAAEPLIMSPMRKPHQLFEMS